MKYVFDKYAVYPRIYSDLYADFADILYIGDRHRAYEFIHGELIDEMEDDIFQLVSHLDWRAQVDIENLVSDTMEAIRLHHEIMFENALLQPSDEYDFIDEDKMNEIIASLQKHMPQACACFVEGFLSLQDNPIRKSDCIPAPGL